MHIFSGLYANMILWALCAHVLSPLWAIFPVGFTLQSPGSAVLPVAQSQPYIINV